MLTAHREGRVRRYLYLGTTSRSWRQNIAPGAYLRRLQDAPTMAAEMRRRELLKAALVATIGASTMQRCGRTRTIPDSSGTSATAVNSSDSGGQRPSMTRYLDHPLVSERYFFPRPGRLPR